MAKIRGIKPETWTDEKIVSVSPLARLLFFGMWNFACDNGHLENSPVQLKVRILPMDNCNVSELVEELVQATLVINDGEHLTVPNLSDHQRPNKRWWKTCNKTGCTVPEGATSTPNNVGAAVVAPSPTLANVEQPWTTGGQDCSTTDGDVDVDGDGEFEVEGEKPRKRATRLPASWTPTTEHADRAKASGIDLDREVVKFKAWVEDKGQTSKSWNGRFTQWLMKAEEYAQAARQKSGVGDIAPRSKRVNQWRA